MIEESAEVEYGTRWGRAALPFFAALLLVFGLGISMAKGALGASYIATSGAGQFTTDGVRAGPLGLVVKPVPVKDFNGQVSDKWVLGFSIGHAFANGICVSEKATLLGQTVTLLIQGGDDDPSTYEIEVNGISANALEAHTFLQTQGDAYVNKNPADIYPAGSPYPLGGTPFEFGLEAQGAELKGVSGYLQDAQLSYVPGLTALNAKMVMGDAECPEPSG